MSKIIEQLWNGNLAPVEYSGADSTELRNMECEAGRVLDSMEKHLTEKGQKLLLDYEAQKNACAAQACMEAFCDGFSLGIRLVAEALMQTESRK